MSQENVEIVRKVYAAWNSGDVEAALRQTTPDCHLDLRERVFNPEVYEGHDGVREFFAEIRETWESLRIDVEEIREAAERVVSIHTVVGRGRTSGIEVRWPSANVWSLRDGLVASLRMYRDPTEALEAVGPSE